MGAAQSAQRDDKKDSAAEEETRSVDDAQAEQRVEDKPLKKNGQISELNGKADGPIAEEDGHCEDEIAAEAILSPEDVSEAEQPLKEKRPKTEMDENESSNQGDANEVSPMKMTEIDGKQNEINEGLGRFFSNIGFKSTLKRGSAEKADESTNKKTNRLEDIEDAAKETKNDNAEHNTDLNNSTCPTLTDITSQDVPANQKEKTEIKEEAQLDNGGETTTSPVGEDDATPEEEVVVSPIKRFFTTGIFSGLRKKKQLQSIDTNEKEFLDNGKMEVTAKTEQTLQQEDTEEISLGVEAATAETEHKDNEHQEEILSATSIQTTDEAISPSTDPTIIVSEPEILSSQEKDKVQASPLKKLMSGSSLKKLSKKQRGRKSSDTKLSDSGEHISDQLLSSTKSAESQKEESHAGEEESAWASFKKLVTPKKHAKRSSLTNEETLIQSSAQESKPGDGEQISDHSTDEGKKRKDSSVSWEAVLCGSGRRRSRKTSDSEDEVPQVENDNNKQESPLESSNDGDEISTCYPKQVGSASEGDGGSTWKSFKKLVTPKRKVKNQDDNDIIQSDSEVTQDESSSAIKKLLPGRTKKRPAEKQDQVSSDEADKEIASDDEDTETPAVVPLSEFDTAETGVLQTKADVESHVPNEADDESQQKPLDQPSEPRLPCDSLQSEVKKVQDDKNALENKTATLVSHEEPEDFTEFISKHQQLSDIPEEGVITETMATPPSVAEEPARDDTIAEDLIEITSEAITAPEPVDITIADETEMISAVSQLSESSTTSGNTTPVPAEYEVKDTELVLQQVVETISISPKVALVCSDELRSERIVASVSHQILETFTKQETTILEIHTRSEAIDISTGLNVKELDAISELAATAQSKVSKVKEAVSNEIVSNDPTEQFETAGIAVDDVHVINVKHPEESIKELESTNEIHGQVECQTEASSTDILLESEDTVADDGLPEAHQAERKSSHSDFHDADSAAPVSEETKTGAADTEVQTMSETKDEITQIFTDQVQAEDQDQPPAVTAEEEATLNSEEGTFQLTVKEVGPEDIRAVEMITDEHTEEVEPFTEVSTEPEKEDELQTDAAEVKDDHVTKVVQVAAVDLEMVCIQTSKKETQLPKETVTDQPKQTAKDLTEVCAGPENTESPVDNPKIEHYQAKEVLEDIQVPTLDLEEGSVHPLKQEVRSETSPVVETDESKEETESLTEVSIKSVGDSKNGHVQDPDVLETVQVVRLDSEVSFVTFEKEETAAETPPIESVADKPTQATEEEELPADHAKTEQLQDPDVLETVQVVRLDSEEISVVIFEKEETAAETPPTDSVSDKPTKATEEEELPADHAKTEQLQDPDVLETVQVVRLDSEEISVVTFEKEETAAETPPTDSVSDKPTKATEEEELPTEHVKTEQLQEPDVLETVQVVRLDSEEISVVTFEKEETAAETPPTDSVSDKPTKATEGSAEPEEELPTEHVKTEQLQEPDVLETVQVVKLYSNEVNVTFEMEETAAETPPTDSVTDKPTKATEGSAEPEEELPTEHVKTEQLQEPDVLETVQVMRLDSEEISVVTFEEEETAAEAPPIESGTDKPTKATEEEELPTEHVKTEQLQEPDVLETVQVVRLDSEEVSVVTFEKEETAAETPPTDSVADKPTKATEGNSEPEEELPAEHAKTEQLQEPDILETVQVVRLDSELSAVTFEKEETAAETPSTDSVADKPTQATEQEELPTGHVKTKQLQEPDVLETVQVMRLDSEEISVVTFEKEKTAAETPPIERGTDKPTKATEEEELPTKHVKTEQLQEPDILETVQVVRLDSEEIGVVTFEEEETAAETPPTDSVADKPTKATEEEELPTKHVKTEQLQEPDVLETVQVVRLDSEEIGVVTFEKEETAAETPPTDSVADKQTKATESSAEPEEELPAEHNKTEQLQEPDVLETVQVMRLDSEEISVVTFEKEETAAEAPPIERGTDKPTKATEEEELPTEHVKTEQLQEPDVLETVQVVRLDSEEVSVVIFEKEETAAETPPTDSVADKPTKATEGSSEPEEELPAEHAKTEQLQEPDVLETVQVVRLDSELSAVTFEKEETAAETQSTESVADKPTQATEQEELPTGHVKTKQLQEPDVLETVQVMRLDSEEISVVTFEKEETAAETPPIESVADKPTKAIEEEELPTEHDKTEQLQEPHVSQCDGKDTITKTETEEAASISGHGVSESVEEGSAYSAEEPEIQELLDDAPNLNASVVIVSITDKSESESELNQALKINKDQKAESITEDSQVKQEDRIPEAVDKLQPLSTVHILSANVQPSGAEVLEKTVISEETPASCVYSALVTYEHKHDMHLSEVQVSVEAEKQGELPDAEIKTAAAEHAIVAQVTTCSLKEVLAAIPGVLLEETDSHESLTDMVARQLEFKEEVEASAPLVKEDVTQATKEESVVVMMHVPSVEFEDSHRIQVQVVDVNRKSPEMTVDSGLEVGITEPRQVLDVCHVTVKPVDNLSATQDTELNNEENKVHIKEVIQHVKENLPEAAPELLVVQTSIQDEVVDLKKEDIIQPDDLTEVSEMAENESNQVEIHKVMVENTGTSSQRQDEATAVISDNSATEQHVSEDLMQTPNIEGTTDDSIHDLKEELEDCKAELEQSVAEEAKGSELDIKKTNGETQIPQISQTVTPSNDGLIVPQNNTIISSVGNLESPSCLSLELKLNIQFGQTKAPASPPPTTDRTEPVNQTDKSGGAVRTEEIVEPEEPVEAKPRAESQKQTALCEVSVQATGITETELTNSDSIQTAVIMNQPVLLDISIQAMETVELAEHIKSTGRVTPKVELTETSVCQTEEREFLSQPVLSEACDKETKAQEPVKQREEENEQDVWMDAEEDIDTEAAHHTEDDQEVMAGPEYELDLAPSSKTKEKGQQPHKTAVTCETTNESEDFAVALQHSQTATVSVATLDWD